MEWCKLGELEIKEAAVASFGWGVVVIAPHMVEEMVVVASHMVWEMVVAEVAAVNLEVEEVKLGLELVKKEVVAVESECNMLEVEVKTQGLVVVVVVVVQEGEVSKLVAVAMTDIWECYSILA